MPHLALGARSFTSARRRLFHLRPAYVQQNEPLFSVGQLVNVTLALCVCGLAFWLRVAIDNVLPPGLPFLTFFPAIIFCAFVLGMWPGIACAAMGGLLSVYFLVPPNAGFTGLAIPPSAWVAIGFYAFISGAFILMLATMDRLLLKAEVAQRQAEANSEFQSVMAQEMNHRIKNLFGVITSIVRLTEKSSTDIATFASQLSGRISSLSHAQELVWEAAGQTSVSVREVIERILAPHRSQTVADVNISVTGDCRIEDPHILQILSLIVHELATNAAKYGALANLDGSLQLALKITPPDYQGIKRLVIDWHEEFASDQPTHDSGPGGSGFGTELMNRLVAGVDGRYTQEIKRGQGLDAMIELPLDEHSARE